MRDTGGAHATLTKTSATKFKLLGNFLSAGTVTSIASDMCLTHSHTLTHSRAAQRCQEHGEADNITVNIFCKHDPRELPWTELDARDMLDAH